MKKFFWILLFFGVIALGAFASKYIAQGVSSYRLIKAEQLAAKVQNDKIEKVLEERRRAEIAKDTTVPLFDTDGQINILLLGLDKRVGQTEGHCDVIQFLTLDQKKQEVTITAVPRGTYSPLPPGKGVTSTDYYVSNACGLGGLEYGITQIEKILGQKADYLVVVGFSETLGILRNLHLPTTETLQWLRRRHGYAIGEPQRARNHSTFLKTLMMQYLPKEKSALDIPLRYLMYNIVQTDLSFDQAIVIVDALGAMDFANHSERIHLSMRPAHAVQDIAYDPTHLDLKPGSDTEESIQKKLLAIIEQKKNNAEFVAWAYDNNLWLQIEDEQKRESVHYDFFEKYLSSIKEKPTREALLGDYILEMEYRGQTEWMQKGKALLTKELEQ